MAQQSPARQASNLPSLTSDEIRQLIRKVADNDLANDKLQRDYTYLQREEEHRLSGNGRVTSTEIKTSEILEIYGEQVERLISKDDNPLSAKDARKEEEKIQKLIDKRKDESAEDRRKREEKGRKGPRGGPKVRDRGRRCLQFQLRRRRVLGRPRHLCHRR